MTYAIEIKKDDKTVMTVEVGTQQAITDIAKHISEKVLSEAATGFREGI